MTYTIHYYNSNVQAELFALPETLQGKYVRLTERMETKAPAIARLESGGKNSPSIDTLRKYARAVGCKLEVRLVPQG